MATKRPREEDDNAGDEDMDELFVMAARRPNQVFRERRRRRRQLAVRRASLRRRSRSIGGASSTSSEGDRSEGTLARSLGIYSPKNSTVILTRITTAPARLVENKQWYQIPWRNITFAVLSVAILILFLETHLETFYTGRPPYRFHCYLSGLIVCCGLWCLMMTSEEFQGDLRNEN
ncbi:hypothetical protein KR038_000404 [Drosophila bunnanda]|nr:hypothetical protein KR038_000404 [Drosophila bunnanda]